jgi:hypothetical protein
VKGSPDEYRQEDRAQGRSSQRRRQSYRHPEIDHLGISSPTQWGEPRGLLRRETVAEFAVGGQLRHLVHPTPHEVKSAAVHEVNEGDPHAPRA